MLEAGIPRGIWTVIVCPVMSLTVSVHESAEALGNATTPIVTSIAPASARIAISFRLSSNIDRLLQEITKCAAHVRSARSDVPRKLLIGSELCNAEPRSPPEASDRLAPGRERAASARSRTIYVAWRRVDAGVATRGCTRLRLSKR